MTLETARLLKEDFLQQNSFTPHDKFCPFYKSVWMLRNMLTFHRLARKAVGRSSASGRSDDSLLTLNVMKQRLGSLLYKLSAQKFEDPSAGEDVLKARFAELHESLIATFRALEEEYP